MPGGGGLTTAMVLAAGYGRRMRPLTDEIPKPLVPLLGRTLIDRVIDHLLAAGVKRIVVNAHHLADALIAHFDGRREVVVTREHSLLETGGGVKNALPLLRNEPFFVVNSDAVWLDGPVPALRRLATAWDDSTMDALLLLQPTSAIDSDAGLGDYHLSPEGLAQRRRENTVAPFLFAGIQILHPRAFANTPAGPFSLNVVYDCAEEAGRLSGLVHDGEWYHVGTPEQLCLAEQAIAQGHVRVNSR